MRKQTRSRIHYATLIEVLETRQLMSTVVVNTTADSTDAKGSSTVSLRDAIAIANPATSATTITFSTTVFNTAKTITLGGSLLELSNSKAPTTVTGPAVGVTVNGNHKSTVFQIDPGVSASLSGLTISNGTYTGGGGGGGGGIDINQGTLTLSNSTLSGNTAGLGGAILDLRGIATLTNVTLSGNTASSNGGAIDSGSVGGSYNSSLAVVTLIDSTVSGNTAPNGGGMSNFYGSDILINTTVTGNTGSLGGGLMTWDGPLTISDSSVVRNKSNTNQGGGITTNDGGTVAIGNSVVALNTVASGTGLDVQAAVTSEGHNLIGKVDGSSGWIASDLTGTIAKPLDPKLGSLANNGGPTQTLLPLTASPLLGAGSASEIPKGISTDQRGYSRSYGGSVDIGSVEVQPLIQITAPGNQTATVKVSKSFTLGSFKQYTNDTPFKDTVIWGDGSGNSTVSLTAAGTIPATAHTFAKTGTFTVTETIADAKGNKSNTVSFTVTVNSPAGTIAGLVFDDTDGNGKQDKGEIGLGLWTVYLDINDNSKLDTGDKSVTTDINGKFSFSGLAAGTYYLRIVPVTGDTTTTPSGGLIKIVLTAGEVSSTNYFGEN